MYAPLAAQPFAVDQMGAGRDHSRVDRRGPSSILLSLLACDDGRLAGRAWLNLPVGDNAATAQVDIVTHPDLEHHGADTALAAATRERLRARAGER